MHWMKPSGKECQALTHESVLDQNFWLTAAGKGVLHIMEFPLITLWKGCVTATSSAFMDSRDITPRTPVSSA